MLSVFISAFLLGLLFNAAPGAVFAESVKRNLQEGFRGALAVQVGSLAGDALWAVLGLGGIGFLLQLEALHTPLGVAGVLYLLWLSWDSWTCARVTFDAQARPVARTGSALRAGVLLSITNPQNLAFWAAVGSALGALGIQEPTATHYTVYFAGFMASSTAWCFVCAWIIDRLFRRMGMNYARMTYRACALAFLALAAMHLRELVKSRTDGEAPTDRERIHQPG